MIFKIEVDDFWLDDDRELEPALKSHIIREVTDKINKSIKDKIETDITAAVKKATEEIAIPRIQTVVGEIMSTTKIKSDNEDITIEEYVRRQFVKQSGWRSPDDQIKKIAEAFGNEMKKRFDIMFATHIVNNMKANGLLKDDVAKLLLSEEAPK